MNVHVSSLRCFVVINCALYKHLVTQLKADFGNTRKFAICFFSSSLLEKVCKPYSLVVLTYQRDERGGLRKASRARAE